MKKQTYISPILEIANLAISDVLTDSEGADFNVSDLLG